MQHPLLRFANRNFSYLVFLGTGIVFFPVISWLLDQTIANNQLLNAFVVLIFSGALILYERDIKLTYYGKLDTRAQNLLIASYGVLVVAVITHYSLIILLSLSLSLGSFLWFLFGPDHRRFILSGLVAFTLFAAIALLLPVLDWPLRAIAGEWAAFGLDTIGQQADLRLNLSGEVPRLLLLNNQRQFHVASECNGFGMLGSCMLMTTFVILYRRMSTLKRLAIFASSILFGLTCNVLRIMIIVLLAQRISFSRYNLMHETVGIIVTYGGLLLLFLAIMPKQLRHETSIGPTISSQS